MWPGSPAKPCGARAAARRRRRCPPPMPVPSVTSTSVVGPVAGTDAVLGHVAQLASLSTATGSPVPRPHRRGQVEVDDPGQVRGEAEHAGAVDQAGGTRRRRRPAARARAARLGSRLGRPRSTRRGHDARRRPVGVSTRRSASTCAAGRRVDARPRGSWCRRGRARRPRPGASRPRPSRRRRSAVSSGAGRRCGPSRRGRRCRRRSRLGTTGQRGLDRLLDDVVDRRCISCAARPGTRGRSRPRCPQPSQRQPGLGVAGGHQQLLDPALDEGLRARGRGRRRPGCPSPPGVRSAADRIGLPLALDLALDVEGGLADVGQGGPDADGDAAAQPLAQVRVEHRLERAGDGVGRADGEVLEGLVLEDLEGDLGGVAQVGWRPAPRRGRARRPGRCGPGCRSRGAARRTARSGRPARRAGTRTCGPAACRPAARRSGRTPGPRDSSWATAGRLVDHDPAAHRHGQRHDLPEVGGRAARRWPGRGCVERSKPPFT